MAGTPTDDGAQDRAAVPTSSTRDRILAVVRMSARPATAAEVAAEVGVHRTVARLHLRHLAAERLVHEVTLPPTGRGRPRLGYRALDEQPYRTVASWLATAVSPDEAVAVGRSVGASYARSADDAVTQIADEASLRGFDPIVEVVDDHRVDVVLRACPFASLARQSPDVICGLHRGIMEGIAANAVGAAVVRLDVGDPTRGECRLVLRRTPT